MTFLALVLTLILRPPTAHAWGDEGHEVVARIAEHGLQPVVRQRVLALLATDTSGLVRDTGMAAEATWADRFRDSDRHGTRIRYLATRQWHFVDLEITGADLEAACFHHPSLGPELPASDGPAADCIIDKVVEFRDELAAPRTNPAERLEALQFLLHLVGDLHQPLHAADREDRGGNAVWVEDSSGRHGKLHEFWDTEFVRRLGPDPQAIAESMIRELDSKDWQPWMSGTPERWALESYAVARESAYGHLGVARADGSYVLSDAYVAEATATVRLQLERAGVRLASLLNAALR